MVLGRSGRMITGHGRWTARFARAVAARRAMLGHRRQPL
ncbi:hypothetical protein L195_g064722, partial [Trifolium pratense]